MGNEANSGDTFTRIAHHGSVIELNAPASQLLELRGDIEPVLVTWSPVDRQATQVEVRARIVGSSAALGETPIVRWADEVAHGNAVWREPQPALSVIAGTPVVDYTLPGRGMAWRVTNRELRLSFRNGGTILGGVVERSVVQVTVNPVYGSVVDKYPYEHFAGPALALGGRAQPFPMTAREWRLTDDAGLPLGAGPGVAFVSVTGGLFGINPASAFADFQPIPHDAANWLPTVPMYAAFR